MAFSTLFATLFALITCLTRVDAHGDPEGRGDETIQQYAARHMASEHHIDTFDAASFFQLHDLNRDGFWDKEEIEAIYGVHHVYSQKKSKDDEEHQKKADTVSSTILNLLDSDRDGRVSLMEFESKGLDSLPNFNHLGAEGHHYDVESEFFLHHEEQYHSTPETQTDEAYTHDEDLEHFAQHDAIEAEELKRERKYQGIIDEEGSSEEAAYQEPLDSSDVSKNDTSEPDEKQPIQPAGHAHDNLEVSQQTISASKPRYTRADPKAPYEKYAEARKEGKEKAGWGQGEDGYKTPKTPADKLRRNLPYKYKFRRNWGDF